MHNFKTALKQVDETFADVIKQAKQAAANNVKDVTIAFIKNNYPNYQGGFFIEYNSYYNTIQLFGLYEDDGKKMKTELHNQLSTLSTEILKSLDML